MYQAKAKGETGCGVLFQALFRRPLSRTVSSRFEIVHEVETPPSLN
jgi:hypothetical protein